MLKVAAILEESIVDGPGIRSVIFFQGCPRHCEGCHNPDLLPFEGGKDYSPRSWPRKFFKADAAASRYYFKRRVPLAQADDILEFLKLIRSENPKLTVWCYTGYRYDEVKDYPVLQEIDVLVDGPFILAQRNLDLPFRGSDNQRLIDLTATRKSGSVVEVNL